MRRGADTGWLFIVVAAVIAMDTDEVIVDVKMEIWTDADSQILRGPWKLDLCPVFLCLRFEEAVSGHLTGSRGIGRMMCDWEECLCRGLLSKKQECKLLSSYYTEDCGSSRERNLSHDIT